MVGGIALSGPAKAGTASGFLDTGCEYAKLEGGSESHPPDELEHGYPGCMSRLQEKLQRRRQVCRQDGAVSEVQDEDHDPGETGRGQDPHPGGVRRRRQGRHGKAGAEADRAQEARIKPLAAAAIGGAVVAAVIWALLLRFVAAEAGTLRFLLIGIGLLLVSPPLAAAAYGFLRDDEFEAYRGKQLFIRAAVCAVVYMILWAVFPYVKSPLADPISARSRSPSGF